MQPSKKFAFDVGITFLASVVSLALGFVIQTSKSFRRYLSAGDSCLYRFKSTIYGIALLVAAIGIPAVMIYLQTFNFKYRSAKIKIGV